MADKYKKVTQLGVIFTFTLLHKTHSRKDQGDNKAEGLWYVLVVHSFPSVLNANVGLLHLIQRSVEQAEDITNFVYGLVMSHDLWD